MTFEQNLHRIFNEANEKFGFISQITFDLEDTIYKNLQSVYCLPLWRKAAPVDMPPDLDEIIKYVSYIDGIQVNNIIGFLYRPTTITPKDIIFTTKSIHIINTGETEYQEHIIPYEILSIPYISIKSLILDEDENTLEIYDINNKYFICDQEIWNMQAVYYFLEHTISISKNTFNINKKINEHENIHTKYHSTINSISPEFETSTIPGTIYSNVSSGMTVYGEEKFCAARGHGFAAERANHLYDKLSGHDAHIVGDSNIKDGPDRLVDGIYIQSKYCKTGSKCISECFKDNKYRYLNDDGTPMKVEVPSDKYDAALAAMRERIRRGEVPGVTNPDEAKNIVQKGHFTYEQVKNIAKAGTIESLTYDAVNGSIIAAYSFGITSVISFATSLWNGDNFDIALKKAVHNGISVFGTSFMTAIIAGQVTKAGLNRALVGVSDYLVKCMGNKGASLLANAFRSGKDIYGGAAMNSAAKLLRVNIITAAATIVVLSSVDIVNTFRGRISGAQLFKNVTTTVSSVAGGTAGWAGGAMAGAALGSCVPVIGNAAGAIIGGIIGSFCLGSAAACATSAIMDKFVEDDAKEMVDIIEKEFLHLAEDYLLNQHEVEMITAKLADCLTGDTLKDMFASSDRTKFAQSLLLPHIEDAVAHRNFIQLPDPDAMRHGLLLWCESQGR